MTNAKILKTDVEDAVMISCREVVETDERGTITLKHTPTQPVFVYDKNTGEKI
jgi:hypothetical protein